MRMYPGSGIPCCRGFLEVRCYLLPKRIYHRRKMKVAKRTAQAFASIAVLSLLMTGSVFAYSTRLSHISSFAAPSPLADDKSSSTQTSTSETEHENDKVNETTHTSENGGEHNLEFKLAAVGSAAGKGDAEVQIRGTDVRVDVQVEQALKSTSYTVT